MGEMICCKGIDFLPLDSSFLLLQLRVHEDMIHKFQGKKESATILGGRGLSWFRA